MEERRGGGYSLTGTWSWVDAVGMAHGRLGAGAHGSRAQLPLWGYSIVFGLFISVEILGELYQE